MKNSQTSETSPASSKTDTSAQSIYYDDAFYDSLKRPSDKGNVPYPIYYGYPTNLSFDTSESTLYSDQVEKRALEIKNELALLERQDLEAKERNARKCCCCFPRNKTGKTACIVTFGLLLTIIGVILYLFIPRMPDFQLAALETQGSNPFTLVKNPGDAGNYTMNLNLILTVRLVHKNYYPFKVNDITVKTYLLANLTRLRGSGVPGSAQLQFKSDEEMASDAKRLVATGRVSNLEFPPNVVNTFKIPLVLTYTPRSETGGLTGDVVVGEIYQACNIDRKGGRPMTVSSDTITTVKGLSSLGFNPKFNNVLQATCPLAPENVDKLLTSFNLPRIAA